MEYVIKHYLTQLIVQLFNVLTIRSFFPTIQQKAARLAFGLIKNHPFIDGNKRIGTHSMLLLLLLTLNGIDLSYTQEELYTIILKIAAGTSDLKELNDWILNHQI